jgi:hypothetical protein
MSDFKREIEWTPAFDKRHTDPQKNYGIHGVNMKWLLTGPKGVIQFMVYTNWHLPHVRREREERVSDHYLCQPIPADVGYHSPTPMHEGEKPCTESCPYLGGKPCYYDGSGMAAVELFDVLVTKGGEAVWEEMEDTYRSCFEEGEEG